MKLLNQVRIIVCQTEKIEINKITIILEIIITIEDSTIITIIIIIFIEEILTIKIETNKIIKEEMVNTFNKEILDPDQDLNLLLINT